MPQGTKVEPAAPLRGDTAPVEQPFEKTFVEEDVFLRVLKDSIDAIKRAEIPFVVIGGIPSAVLGRPRWTEDGADIDFFFRAQDVRKALEAFDGAGFATKEWEPHWLYKATKDRVVVDIIYRSTGDIYLDDEMLDRSFVGDFKGVAVPLVAAEDLAVMKAVAHSEATARYWHDALALVANGEFDWDYLIRRARRHGAHRVLSLLIYAQSNDIAIPNAVIRTLFDAIYGE